MSSKPGSSRWPGMKLGRCLPTVRAATGMEAARDQREALVWNVGTLSLDAKGDIQVADPLGAEYRCLGFTFIFGKTQTGKFQLKRKTRRDRMRAKLKMIKEEMWKRMHAPIPDQGKWLRRVVQGYFNYYAVPTNAQALGAFRHHVTDLWRRTLRRRSQKDGITWARMTKLVDDWLPKPTILHPWPSDRFAVTHPRWKPYAGKPPVRLWAGGVR